jgi:ABC-type multidrug transport system fused ATPase/permease subunit
MDFFDTTTSGSVLNRFSSDQQLVDMQLRGQMASLFNSAFQLLAGLGVVLATSPLVLLLLPPLSVAYRNLQATYATSAREVQRLQSIARSPILQEVTEMVAGLATVRAFRKGPELQRRVASLIDRQARAIRCSSTMRAWLTLRLEALGAVVVLGVGVSAAAAEAWAPGGANAALVGLSLSYVFPSPPFPKAHLVRPPPLMPTTRCRSGTPSR